MIVLPMYHRVWVDLQRVVLQLVDLKDRVT